MIRNEEEVMAGGTAPRNDAQTFEGLPLSKWWTTESAKRAFARVDEKKAVALTGMKARLAKLAEEKARIAREAMMEVA